MENKRHLKDQLVNEAYEIIETKLVPNKNFNSHLYFKNKKTVKIIMVNFDGFKNNKKYRLKNLQDHKYERASNEDIILSGTLALYSGKYNTIYINESKNSTELLVHEFLHMANYESEENPGFMCRFGDDYFEHLNEGIVQYLTRKLVEKKESSNCIYSSQVRIAMLLEYIVGEDELLYYFSNLKFREMNKAFPLPKEKFAILKLACLTENFHDLLDEKLNYERTKKEIKKLDQKASRTLDLIQKLLTELYTSHRLKYATKEEVEKFLNSLITVDVDNPMIQELLKPVLPKKENIHKKMNLKIKKYIRE